MTEFSAYVGLDVHKDTILLRHGRVYRAGKSRWTQRHFQWLEEQRFDSAVQQVVFQEYVDTVMEARRRVAGLEGQMREALERWSLRPAVEGLMALRGVDVVTAMTVLAEVGDLTRFDSPRENTRQSAVLRGVRQIPNPHHREVDR